MVAALAVVPFGGGPHAIRPAMAAAAVPSATSAYYVYGSFVDACGLKATTECPLYDYGAAEAVPASGGMTILDFGAPCYEPATLAWGTQLFNSQSCTPNAAIVVLAGAWLRGYASNPHRAASPAYVLAVGTSNSLTAAVPGNSLTTAQMAAHGQAWFTSVVSPLTSATTVQSSPVTIWAGDDIEESNSGDWYDSPTTTAWVDAYSAASGASKPCVATKSALMVDYGDYVPNVGGWSVAAVYHVAWQAPPACPVPEIYEAANAAEWQSLNSYALGAGLPQVQFTGVLSEDGAAGSLTSSDSWTSLRDVSGQAAPYLSVIGLTSPVAPEVPDAPSAVRAIAVPGLILLGWSAPAWDGGAAVTSYTVTVYAASVQARQITISGSPAPESVIVRGLRDGVAYTFHVSASNRVGTGPQSLPSSPVTPSAPIFLG